MSNWSGGKGRPRGHHRSATLPGKPCCPKLGTYPKYGAFTAIIIIIIINK
jgi:hypothetical protein